MTATVANTRAAAWSTPTWVWLLLPTVVWCLYAIVSLTTITGTLTHRIALVGTVFGSAAATAFWVLRRHDPSSLTVLGTAAMVSASVTAFLQLTGSYGPDLYPLFIVVVAVMASRTTSGVGLAVVVIAIATASIAFVSGSEASAGTRMFVGHLLILGTLGGVHTVLGRREAEPSSNEEHRPAPRLPAPTSLGSEPLCTSGPIDLATLRPMVGLDETLEASLSLLKKGLSCHTAALYWLDGQQLTLRSAVGATSALRTTANPGQGALASMIRTLRPVRLTDIRQPARQLPYYGDDVPTLGAFLGVPVCQGDAVVGLVCLDRLRGRPFSAGDEAAAVTAAANIQRTVQSEQMHIHAERTRSQLGRLYEASRRLNQALTQSEVFEIALNCMRDVQRVDLIAFVAIEEDAKKPFVVERVEVSEDCGRALTNVAKRLDGHRFGQNTGLVSMAIDMGHYLPYNGDYRPGRSMVFSKNARVVGVESLLVLPLLAHDSAIGALVVARRSAGAFDDERREMLEVIANQVATSLANARMYEQMKQMATTDGLTGLNNHRTFKTRLAEVMARSDRGAGTFGLILTDIDHFKSVNDTHGHPVGDEVLRQVSATIQHELRQTDIPARYGGEEFAIILEATDLHSALTIAERLRKAAAALRFDAPAGGQFSITMSFGVAQYPADADEQARLIDRADQSLYYAKTHGRDQVRVWRDVHTAPDFAGTTS